MTTGQSSLSASASRRGIIVPDALRMRLSIELYQRLTPRSGQIYLSLPIDPIVALNIADEIGDLLKSSDISVDHKAEMYSFKVKMDHIIGETFTRISQIATKICAHDETAVIQDPEIQSLASTTTEAHYESTLARVFQEFQEIKEDVREIKASFNDSNSGSNASKGSAVISKNDTAAVCEKVCSPQCRAKRRT